MRRPPVLPLSEAIATLVSPGRHLHFASTPSRSNAAIRAVCRQFRGQWPGFTLSTSGFHSTAHLLGMCGLGARYLACFFGDNYPSPRPSPLYARLLRAGAALEHWSLLTYVTALRAGALGHAWGVTRSLSGTTLGDELKRLGRFVELPDPVDAGKTLGLVRAIRPDLTFVHAPVADEHGHVLFSAPRGEGAWAALGAREGVVVTVEERVTGDLSRSHPDAILVPPHRIRAICVEPLGAHPQPMHTVPALGRPGYADDFDAYQRWARAAAEADERTIDALLGEPPAFSRPRPKTPTAPSPAADALVVAAARTIAERVRRAGYKTILAGIGQGFLAARMAKILLAEEGIDVAVLVETGLYALDCGPEASPFLLARDNAARAGRLTDIDDVLGALASGAGQECLAVLGAAQVDARGRLNSTRLADGTLLVGSGGASDVAAAAAEVVVVMRAAPGRLVPEVDYVTSPGGKVRAVVTDKGVLEREGDGWRLASHAGDPAELRGLCPWPLLVPDVLPAAEPISAREAALLESLDPEGIARERRASPAGPASRSVSQESLPT